MVGKDIATVLFNDKLINRVAFLPHCQQMADSLWSVYQECLKIGMKCLWHPIGYIELDGERRQGRLHSFGDTTYEDFKNFAPDTVVIEYPYDRRNVVTTISTEYLSLNLYRDHTVVYIPYFCGGCRDELKRMPGVKYADYIFAPNEDEAREYSRIYPMKKVYAYGSPKTDLLKYTTGDNILVANSLMPFINKPWARIRKYKEIIEQNENVIFRAHPLIGEGLKSMRPDFIIEWHGFLTWAATRCEIDSRPYAADTMNICKMMYADPGSLVTLWRMQKKPYEIIEVE